METPKIKGAGFVEILKWYATTPQGPARLKRAVQKLPPDLRGYITRPDEPTLGVLAGTWYPAPLVGHVFGEMTSDLSPLAVRQLAIDAVKASVGTTLNGLYAGIFRMLVSPKMLANNYNRLWRLYHNTGEFEVIIESPTRFDFRLSKWPVHDSFFCQMNLQATKLILEMLGMKEVMGQLTACVDRGDAHCSYLQMWKG
ncbi:Hypothetical protein A7982_03762 [Minicystis rosea]|nr:Hypothetical protein A7982_03762 [Minicystis rosea]